MKQLRWLGAALLLVALSGCFERSDSLAPLITISNPRSGTVRTAENLTISGYAVDDEGIAAIRVDEFDLLSSPIFQSDRGKRLVEFGFRPQQITEGRWASTIIVEDVSGRSTRLDYTLEIDATPPTLDLDPVQRLGDGRLRISGIARDNNLLARIAVAGIEVSVLPVSEKAFSLDVTVDGSATIIVEDEAGNRLTREIP
ncbi:MAG: hypothetical protein U5L04_14245 [Trueperaceae bacterium]|nr:hypothetical protein [Trueperaceae bacterium]